MRILIVTPAPPRSETGNRITALRWARILRRLGHGVRIDQAYTGQPCEVLVALHARKSARSVARYQADFPQAPLILALTGTDLYGDIKTSATAQRSLELASRLVLLQAHGISRLPRRFARKARVIYQSATAPRRAMPPLKRVFEACVIGHLRAVKDPFRAAQAVRRLPETSRIRIVHAGQALGATMQRRAEKEMWTNPRYCWLGGLPWWKARQRLARARLLIITSKMEGGANVLSEALASSVPVISSRVSGSIGLLGEDYPGYFEVGDTERLAALLHRAERDVDFYSELSDLCRRRVSLVDPQREENAWDDLLGEF